MSSVLLKDDPITRKRFKQYSALFRDFDLARRLIPVLRELSEEVVVKEDDTQPSGLSFENILSYNKIGSKNNSEVASNMLSRSLAEWNLLTDLSFTVEREGKVVLEPQQKPVGKKPPVNEPKLNPTLNLTDIVNDLKDIANTTYDNKDLQGNTLNFNTLFVYLHHLVHDEVPSNAKKPALRTSTISNARKRIKQKLKEQEEENKTLLTEERRQTPTVTRMKDGKVVGEEEGEYALEEINYDTAFSQLKNLERVKFDTYFIRMKNYLEYVETLEEQINKTVEDSNERLDTLKRQADKPDYYSKVLGEISDALKQTIQPPSKDIEGYPSFEEETKRREKSRKQTSKVLEEKRKILQEFKDNPDSLSGGAKKIKAKVEKEILEALNEEEAKNTEIKESARNALQFIPFVKQLSELFEKIAGKDSPYPPINDSIREIKIQEGRLEEEEEETFPDKNVIDRRRKNAKDLKNFSNKQNDIQRKLASSLTSLKILPSMTNELRELLKDYSADEEFKTALSQLGVAIGLKSKAMIKIYSQELEPMFDERDYKDNKGEMQTKTLKEILAESPLSPLLEDNEAFKILSIFDKFIIKISDLETVLDNMEDEFERLEESYDKVKILLER